MPQINPPVAKTDNAYDERQLLLMLLAHRYPDNSLVTLPTVDGQLAYLGDEQLTSLAASTGLVNIPTGTVLVVLQAEGANIRFRGNSSVPTVSLGMRIWQDSEKYYNADPSGLRFIQETTGGKLNVMYFGVS